MAIEILATRRRFTRKEYHRMGEAGILRKGDRVELIRGEIIEEAGIPEYWLVACAAETIEVHRVPSAEGYRDIRLVAGAAELAPQAFHDVALSTTDIFA